MSSTTSRNHVRLRVLGIITAVLVVPTAALADIGPHSNFYDQHPAGDTHKNDVTVLLDRRAKVATVSVRNYCLGAEFDGGERFPKQADITVRVRDGRLSFDGKARIIAKTGGGRIAAVLSARIEARRIVGDAAFPHRGCGEISFVAKQIERTT